MAGFTSSNINYGDFYSGSMQPPVIANGLPTQSAVGPRQTGIADLYGSAGGSHPVEGALSLNGDSGLTSHSVHTVPVDMYGNPVPTPEQRNANDTIVNRPAPTASNPTPYTANGVNPLDNRYLGLTEPSHSRQTPAQQAIAAATSIPDLFGPTGWVDSFFGGHYPNSLDFSGPPNNFNGVPAEGDPWAGSRGPGQAPVAHPGLVTGSGAYGPIADTYANPAPAFTPIIALPNVAGNGPVLGTKMTEQGYTTFNGDNGVAGNSGNWFNQVTGRG